MDKRSRKTKTLLNDILITLLKNKSFDRITVTEICQIADVNRATYYYYFTDPYHQMACIRQAFFEEIKKKMTDQPSPSPHVAPVEKVVEVCRHYQKNRDIYLAIITVTPHREYIAQLKDILLETITQNLLAEGISASDEVMEKLSAFLLAGCDYLFQLWLQDNNSLFSPEDCAEMMMKLCYEGIKAYMQN